MMNDRELYAKILGISEPWEVTQVELNLKLGGEVQIRIDYDDSKGLSCPECGKECKVHDRVQRSWRHLDTCQYKTILTARVPRVECSIHKVKTIRVPWSERNSRLTSLFEWLIIDWLKEASISAVSERLDLSWHQIDGVMQRAVQRGLKRREKQKPERLGIDETSFQKRHELRDSSYRSGCWNSIGSS